MKRYEYRIEPLTFSWGMSREDQIMEAINRFGQEGWRLNRIHGVFALPVFSWKGGIKLLLERELTDAV